MSDQLLVIHAAVSWALFGLIWTIQVVHYPLFKEVGKESFIAYHGRHMRFITWVVGPLMLAEVGSAAVLLFLGENSLLFWVSLAGLALVWISTVFSQVPLHGKLVLGYDVELIYRLVRGNWWRTLGWSIRAICLVFLLINRI